MDFEKGERIEDHVCEIIVVDFKQRKEVYRCKAVAGEIDKKSEKEMNNAIKSLNHKLKKTA